jgi:hypothetical protein
MLRRPTELAQGKRSNVSAGGFFVEHLEHFFASLGQWLRVRAGNRLVVRWSAGVVLTCPLPNDVIEKLPLNDGDQPKAAWPDEGAPVA